jgi:alpha-D-ribose 1-methylphosphonate 5-triphosphate diphosphatase
MNNDMVFKSARVVLGDEVIEGTLAVSDGRIAGIASGGSSLACAEDIGGDFLVPGLVELHTDNFERHLMPRPKVRWPALPALLAHDAELAASGITTVYDSLGVGDIDEEALRGQGWGEVVSTIEAAGEAGLLRVEHLLHVRCELAAANTLQLFEPFLDNPRVGLISLMDHTPGQRQWENLEQARIYYTGKKGWSDAKFDAQVGNARVVQEQYAAPHRRHFVEYAQARGIALASHDDTLAEHVHEGHRDGVVICEFPTRVASARLARELGQSVLMGAPNVVRGGSHSGNVAAIELARQGLLDTLSSDYIPVSLMMAAFRLVDEAGFSIPQAVATVTRNPARSVGLTDRGEIAPGKRADLVQVRMVDGQGGRRQPVVRAVWRAGRRIV